MAKAVTLAATEAASQVARRHIEAVSQLTKVRDESQLDCSRSTCMTSHFKSLSCKAIRAAPLINTVFTVAQWNEVIISFPFAKLQHV
jgi:hypothetical protein